VKQNVEPTGTAPIPRDTGTGDTTSVNVVITYADKHVFHRFTDDKVAAYWATGTLIELIRTHGIGSADVAVVTFIRR
jgi:hypothetical protein